MTSRMRLLADMRPLRESAEFRRLWLGQTVSTVGAQMTSVAVAVQVYALTQSSLAVGLIGLAVAVPFIVIGLLGGAIADAIDRRKLVLLTSSLLAVVSLALAIQALLDLRVLWLVYALIVAQSCLFAIDGPARRTFVARLLPAERIPAAAALMQLSFQVSLLAGPLLAGTIIGAAGLQAAYLVDTASFAFAIYGVLRLRAMPALGSARPGIAAVIEGLRFLRGQPVLAMVLVVDLVAMVFGMPRALFPALAEGQFGGGPQTVGLLYAAPAIGGLIGAVFSGPLSHIARQGLAVLVVVFIWGVASGSFALTGQLWLAVTLLAIAGAADMVSAVFRATILQVNTPDILRGRVNAVAFVVGAGGPHLGDLEAGVVADLTSPVVSAVSGGFACVAGVVTLAFAVPVFARYRGVTSRS